MRVCYNMPPPSIMTLCTRARTKCLRILLLRVLLSARVRGGEISR